MWGESAPNITANGEHIYLWYANAFISIAAIIMANGSLNTARNAYTKQLLYIPVYMLIPYICGTHIIVNDNNCWPLDHISQQVRSGGLDTACANDNIMYMYMFSWLSHFAWW